MTYCFTWGDSKVHLVAANTDDGFSMCEAKVMKVLVDGQASGQLCDDCQSVQVIDDDNDGVAKTPTTFDEVKDGDYLYLKHRHGGEIYCVRTIETGESISGDRVYILHCSRGLTLTGTAGQIVNVISQYHDPSIND